MSYEVFGQDVLEQQRMRQMDLDKMPREEDFILPEIHEVPTDGLIPDPSVSQSVGWQERPRRVLPNWRFGDDWDRPQVGGLLGPSDAEKTLAKQVLSGFLTNYANALIRVQYSNKALREYRELAKSLGKKETDADVKAVLDGFGTIAKESIAQMKRIKPHLDEYAKHDKGIWDELFALENAYKKQMESKGVIVPANASAKTSGGTEFLVSVQKDGVSQQVGFAFVPVVLVIVLISVTAIAISAVGYMVKQTAKLNAENRASAASRKAFDQLSKSQLVIQKAQDDLKEGKITKEDADKIIANEQKFQENVMKVQEQAAKPAGTDSVPWQMIAVIGGVAVLGYIAYKKGWIQRSMDSLKMGPARKLLKA